MRKNKLYAAMLMLGMANGAHALGLGELNVESALFQPLRADIELYGWDRVLLENLRPSLASQNAYLRANIARPYFLRNLQLEVVRTDSNDAVLRVTSTKPIREPMLDVLLDVQWPGGRLQKQYTIFLDPPITAKSLAAEKQPPAPGSTAAPAPAPAPAAEPPVTTAQTTPAKVQQAVSVAAPGTGTPPAAAVVKTYRVRPGDTLSRIADRFKDDLGTTRDQLMMAILDANPRAFIAGNINGLRGGVELSIPAAEAAASRTPATASALAREQWQAWRARTEPQVAQAETPPAPEEPTGLRLVPTVPEPDAARGQTGAEASAARRELTALENELAQTRQLLFEREAELDVMRSRMAVYDAELQELKSELRDMRTSIGSQAPLTVAGEPPVQSAAESIDLKTLLIALFAVLGGFGLFSVVYRRLTARTEAAEAAAQAAPLPLEINEPLQIRERDEADRSEEQPEPEREPAAELPVSRHLRVDPEAPTEVREIMPEAPPGAGTADRMLVEADVLIQFGFYQRGRELMEQALVKDPGNPHYRLKLMELCHAAEDKEAFRRHAEGLRERITPASAQLWASAHKMTETLFPGDPLFSTSEFSGERIAIGDPNAEETAGAPEGGDQAPISLDDALQDNDPARAEEVEFRAPSSERGPAARGSGRARTSEWLLPDEQLKDFADAMDDTPTSEWDILDHRGEQIRRPRSAGDQAGETHEFTARERAVTPAEPEQDEAAGQTQRWVSGNQPSVDDSGAVKQQPPGVRAEPPAPGDPHRPGAITGEVEALSDRAPDGETSQWEVPDEPRVPGAGEGASTRDWQPKAGEGVTQSFGTGEVEQAAGDTRDWEAPEGETPPRTGDEAPEEPRRTTRNWEAPRERGETQSFDAVDPEPPRRRGTTGDWQAPGAGAGTQSFSTGEVEQASAPRDAGEPPGETQSFATGEVEQAGGATKPHDTGEPSGTTRNWQAPESGGETQSFATGEVEQAGGATKPHDAGEPSGTTRNWQVPESGGETQSFATGEVEQADGTDTPRSADEPSGTTQAFDAIDPEAPRRSGTTRNWQAPEPDSETHEFSSREVEASTPPTGERQPPDELAPPAPGGSTQSFTTTEHEIRGEGDDSTAPTGQWSNTRQSKSKKRRRKRKSR